MDGGCLVLGPEFGRSSCGPAATIKRRGILPSYWGCLVLACTSESQRQSGERHDKFGMYFGDTDELDFADQAVTRIRQRGNYHAGLVHGRRGLFGPDELECMHVRQ